MARKDIEKPKEIIQSYLVTSAKYDFSVYEKRILYRVVELIQAELKGQPIGKGITINTTLLGHKEITMPVSKFMKGDEEDKNHFRVKKAKASIGCLIRDTAAVQNRSCARKAFKRLEKIKIEEDNKRYWAISSVVTNPKIEYGSSTVKFTISELILEKLLDFAKGYSQYELSIAFSFRSQYTMRFYEIISRCSRPSITYSLDRLREMFMLENKYRSVNMLMKFVIDPAQKELKASKAAYWFTYEKIKEGRAFKSIQFNVHYRPDYDKKIPEQTSIRTGKRQKLP